MKKKWFIWSSILSADHKCPRDSNAEQIGLDDLIAAAFPDIYAKYEPFSAATDGKHPFWKLIDQHIYAGVEWVSLPE